MKGKTLVFAGVLFSCAAFAEMPADVLAQLKADVAKKYPGDFSVQKYSLDNQIKAYNFLQTYAPGGVPADVLAKIKAMAESKYPTDFSTQKYSIENQVKSYLSLQ